VQPHVSKVLLASNLPQDLDPVTLFKIFSIYGNVLRVKFISSAKDKALIEFETVDMSILAKENLNSVSYLSRTLQLQFSKHNQIYLGRQIDIDSDVA
jgi:RNA recognition motif-containing protein